jgi:iron complex outermembrane receptor protein
VNTPHRSPLLPLAAALLTCFSPALWAQATSGDGAAGDGTGADKAALARVTVTGSNIRRASAETPSPVQNLTAADIARTGYSTLGEVLQHLSANNMGSLGQATPGAFGAGGSGISLRGLTVGATLVLIDGHRMASYPLPDDGQRDFVDIASIPVEAVERVEVLKDGASAIYGSDAMAGVVNVILKRSHEGTALQAEVGSSSHGDGRMVKVSGIRGFGDLTRDGVAGYLSAGFRRQNSVLLSDRPALGGSDWTRYGGEDLGLVANPELQVAPETRTYSLLGKVTALLPQDWTLSVAASVLGSRATQVGLLNWVSPEGGITTFNFGPNRQNPQPTVLNGTNVIDPATGSPVDHEFSDLPAQRSQTSTQSQRLVAELSGTVAGWDLNATLGLTRVATDLTLKNFVSLPALQAALNSGKYVIGGSNPPSVLSSLTPEGRSTSTNTLNFVSLRASRDLMKLGGGNLALGTGVEFTKRSLDERFPEGFSSGAQASNIYAFGVGKQTITAAYVELAAPLTKQLEIDAAARIDHYDTYGSSVTPKVGIKYVPVNELTLRGTYAGGFRAPNPVEIGTSGSSAGYLPPLVDTALCNFVKPGQPCDIGVGGTQLQLPGEDLRPEKSRSMTLGFIVEPVPTMNISVDYYDIRIRNQIVSVGLFGQGQIDTPDAYGTKLYRVNSPTTPNAAPTSADDTILYGTYPFINLGSARTSGVDVDLRMKLNAGAWGEFTPQLQWSHMIRYTIDRGPGQVYEMAGTHGPSFVSTNTGTPKDRASLGLAWARGPVELSGTLNYISGMKVEDSSYNLPDCASALSTIFPNGLPAGGSPLCRVPSFTTFNLNASWQLTPGLTLRASVTNLFDRAAPIDAFASGSTGGGVSSGGAHYNPSLHQEGAVGRYLTVGASWRF